MNDPNSTGNGNGSMGACFLRHQQLQHNRWSILLLAATLSISAMVICEYQKYGSHSYRPSPSESLVSRDLLDLSNNTRSSSATVTFALPVPVQFLGEEYDLDTTKIERHANNITGSMPQELSELTELTSLIVTAGLTGSLPTEIGLLTSMTRLMIRSPTLVGTIPSQVGLLTALVDLHIWDTSITGTLPSEFGQLTELQTIDLEKNDLSGALPSELDLVSSLKGIWLEGNFFSGAISSGICSSDLYSIGVDCGQMNCGACPGCVMDIEQRGAIEYVFFFADREPNQFELDELASDTFRFFSDTFQHAFPNTFVEFVGDASGPSVFSLASPAKLQLPFTARVRFSACNPSKERLQEAIDYADYERLWQQYIRPGSTDSMIVFVDSATYVGNENKYIMYTDIPRFAIVGNNGDPEDVFPLGLCLGDCDSDEECKDGLMCLQRGSGDLLSECGEKYVDSDRDFCVKIR